MACCRAARQCAVAACIISFQVLYFNSLLYSRDTKLPGSKRARPRRGAAGAGHDHVPGGSTPVLAAGDGRGKLQVGRGGGSISGRLLRRGRHCSWCSRPRLPVENSLRICSENSCN